MPIERYTPRWHSDLVALGDSVFGEGYFAEPWTMAREPNSCLLLSTTRDERLVGFARGRLLTQAGLRAFLENRVTAIPSDLEEADAKGVLGAIEAVAVAPEVRGQGIGTQLLQAIHDALVGMGADKLIVTFKRGPTAARVDGVMSRLGFEFWLRLETYWKDRCDRGEFKCVDRTDHCRCEAMLYRKKVY